MFLTTARDCKVLALFFLLFASLTLNYELLFFVGKFVVDGKVKSRSWHLATGGASGIR